MKILFVNTNEKSGGAAVASKRLFEVLRKKNIDCEMFVQKKETDNKNVLVNDYFGSKLFSNIRKVLERTKIKSFGIQNDNFSISKINSFNYKLINEKKPDLVHLHWINNGFLSIEDISKIKAPIVWTLHDMWAFTGGCHYSDTCERYKKDCGKCPLLNLNDSVDLSNKILTEKKGLWRNKNINIVSLNNWMKNCVKKSSLFKNNDVCIISNTLNLDIFFPKNKLNSRKKFGLSKNKKIILFGAVNAKSDKRKGFVFLEKALKSIPKNVAKNFEAVVFGSSEKNFCLENGLKINFIGKIDSEKKISGLYSCADVFVLPSLEDNLPNTVLEALSCGTPVVAFNIGGVPDMVDHKKNGYLAKPKDFNDLKKGLLWVLNNKDYSSLSKNARKKIIKEFNPNKITNQYIKLYKKILSDKK
jgi:glycosyltransferase involved in cell wall biosynthesis